MPFDQVFVFLNTMKLLIYCSANFVGKWPFEQVDAYHNLARLMPITMTSCFALILVVINKSM